MEKRDLQVQLFEAQEENDEYTVMEIELKLKGGNVMNSHCGIQVCQVELDNFLKHVFQKNVIWDLGLQFGLLQRSANKYKDD